MPNRNRPHSPYLCYLPAGFRDGQTPLSLSCESRRSRVTPSQISGARATVEMKARSYSQNTIKLLFGASGNQCTFPGCTNPVIAPETPLSDAAVVAQICHIYAASEGQTGPHRLRAQFAGKSRTHVRTSPSTGR